MGRRNLHTTGGGFDGQTDARSSALARDCSGVRELGLQRGRSMKPRMWLARLALAVVAATWVSAAQQTAPRLTGGNGTLYIGGYPNLIWIIDEASEKVIGTIQTKTGIP